MVWRVFRGLYLKIVFLRTGLIRFFWEKFRRVGVKNCLKKLRAKNSHEKFQSKKPIFKTENKSYFSRLDFFQT